MPFEFKPQAIPDGFVWKGKCFHLTYPSFVPFNLLHQAMARATSTRVQAYSFVHEEAKDPGEDYTYEHTHAAWVMEAALNVQGSRKMDVFVEDPQDETMLLQLHPHIQPKVTMRAMEAVFTTYHQGRKFNLETGKHEFTKPVALEQSMPYEWNWNQAVIKEIIDAPTLIQATIVGEIRPRTVMDCKVLREDAENSEAKKFKHKFAKDSFYDLTAGMQWFCLHIWGATNLGKTKWAVAQFSNPLLIKPFNSVGGLEAIRKRFDPKFHDGIVCDEADLTFMSRENCIAFLDEDDPFSCMVRYTEFELPPIRKIIISNPEPTNLYPSDEAGAIARRVQVLQITQKTYKDPQPAVVRTPLHTAASSQATAAASMQPTQPTVNASPINQPNQVGAPFMAPHPFPAF